MKSVENSPSRPSRQQSTNPQCLLLRNPPSQSMLLNVVDYGVQGLAYSAQTGINYHQVPLTVLKPELHNTTRAVLHRGCYARK